MTMQNSWLTENPVIYAAECWIYELNVSWDLPVETNWVITRYELAIYEKEKENINETLDAKPEKSRLFNELDTKAGRGN